MFSWSYIQYRLDGNFSLGRIDRNQHVILFFQYPADVAYSPTNFLETYYMPRHPTVLYHAEIMRSSVPLDIYLPLNRHCCEDDSEKYSHISKGWSVYVDFLLLCNCNCHYRQSIFIAAYIGSYAYYLIAYICWGIHKYWSIRVWQ